MCLICPPMAHRKGATRTKIGFRALLRPNSVGRDGNTPSRYPVNSYRTCTMCIYLFSRKFWRHLFNRLMCTRVCPSGFPCLGNGWQFSSCIASCSAYRGTCARPHSLLQSESVCGLGISNRRGCLFKFSPLLFLVRLLSFSLEAFVSLCPCSPASLLSSPFHPLLVSFFYFLPWLQRTLLVLLTRAFALLIRMSPSGLLGAWTLGSY